MSSEPPTPRQEISDSESEKPDAADEYFSVCFMLKKKLKKKKKPCENTLRSISTIIVKIPSLKKKHQNSKV